MTQPTLSIIKSNLLHFTGSDRHSVRTTIPHPQPGSDEVQLAYKFMDLGSCSGGLNRREVAVIFTLELAWVHNISKYLKNQIVCLSIIIIYNIYQILMYIKYLTFYKYVIVETWLEERFFPFESVLVRNEIWKQMRSITSNEKERWTWSMVRFRHLL